MRRRVATQSTTLICSLPRSGSWLLSAGLEATGLGGHPQEYFRRELRRFYTRKWRIPVDAPASRYAGAALADATGANGVAGIKIHWQDFAPLIAGLRNEGREGSDRELIESVMPDVRWVHLVRRDRLRQAVSWARALDSDVWWHSENVPAAERGSRGWDPDMEKIEALYDLLARQEIEWQHFFRRSRISPLEVMYEELAASWEPTMRRVVAYIGVDVSNGLVIPPPPMALQSDGMNARWLDAWRRLRAAIDAPLEPHQPPSSPAAAKTPKARAAHPLAEVVANRRWVRRQTPFPHLVATNVLRADVYERVEAACRAVIAAPVGSTQGLVRPSGRHDAYTRLIGPAAPEPLALFTSRAWHDLLCGATAVAGSGHVIGSLYHHAAGSASGTVHNDLNPGWFVRDASPHEVVIGDPSVCAYTTGKTMDSTLRPVMVARGVVMHFFVGNGSWRRGDGGAIGLYASPYDSVDAPAIVVPPLDNSLVVFECTPFSLHAFLGGHATARNIITTWLHRPYADAVALWGEESIVEWPA